SRCGTSPQLSESSPSPYPTDVPVRRWRRVRPVPKLFVDRRGACVSPALLHPETYAHLLACIPTAPMQLLTRPGPSFALHSQGERREYPWLLEIILCVAGLVHVYTVQYSVST